MKEREGFTLAELVLSVFIFSFIAASLATIVSTTNRHMFQNYRKNIIKTNILISMRSIQNNLSVATRVDSPAMGNRGTVLAFAKNVDQNSQNPTGPGCYPVVAGVQASWHYYCLAGTSLYYHTGTIGTGGAVACGNASPSMWNPGTGYSVPGCASGTLLMEHVSALAPALPGGALFSRASFDGISSVDTVRVLLHSNWSATGQGFGASQRDVDSSLDSVVRFNRSQ